MRYRLLAASAALALMTAQGNAADMMLKAPAAAPPASPWDLAFGSGIASDYVFRGITQSDRKPSANAYFEPRYNVNDSLQLYAGVSGESIDFANRAAAEIDFYGGFRPTFGKLALDFGFWYYWYPGGQCFNALIPGDCAFDGNLPNGDVIKKDLSFYEGYGKFTYTVTDQFSFGGNVWYSPNVLNYGANGTYVAGTVKYILPNPANLGKDFGWFVSADVGHWFLGTSDSFFCTLNARGTACGGQFPGGIPYTSYTTWDVGLALTWKQFTLDLRYYDTNLNQGDCNAFATDFTATGVYSTPINPGGPGSKWCGATFVGKLSVDLTLANLK